MAEMRNEEPEQVPLRLLEPGEELRLTARSTDAVLAVTDQRIIVADDGRVALDVPIQGVRRIQFDIERTRPATLVIVPEDASRAPQVLAIPPEEYDRAAGALALIGRRLAETSPKSA
ncbi:MAG: hypothetical protein ACAH65_00575 [Chloroflexota bacterium]